jgi:hypothetical protein
MLQSWRAGCCLQAKRSFDSFEKKLTRWGWAGWRGGVMEGSGFVRWQLCRVAAIESFRGGQAAPANVSRHATPQPGFRRCSSRINLQNVGTLAGAACFHI